MAGVKTQYKENVGGLYLADATESGGVLSYGTPRLAAGIGKAVVSYNKNPIKKWESGLPAYRKNVITEATISIDTDTLSHAEKMHLYHGLPNPASGEPYEVGADTDEPARVAVGWWAKLSNAGGYLCRWFYDCVASPPDETEESNDNTGPKLTTPTVEFMADRRPSDYYLKREQIVSDLTAVATFFSSVDGTTPDVVIGAVVFNVTAPVKSATPQSTHGSGTGYTAAIAWSPVDATFDAKTVYTATVTYTAASGFAFPADFSAVDVQGLPASGTTSITVAVVSGTSLTITVVYAATAA